MRILFWIDPSARKSIVAKRIRNGTNRSKSAAGVERRRIAPMPPPTRLETESHFSSGPVLPNSDRNPQMLPSEPGQMATVLVAFALMDGNPSQTSAGNEISVPPPATELIAPARKAAIVASSRWETWRTSIDNMRA